MYINGRFTFTNCNIYDNTAQFFDEDGGSGGGVYIDQGSWTAASTFIDCSIYGNTALEGGGGVVKMLTEPPERSSTAASP